MLKSLRLHLILLIFLSILFVTCKDDKPTSFDLTTSGKWYTTSITTTNYDKNNKIVEKPKIGVSAVIVDSLNEYCRNDFAARHSLEFLDSNKLRLSTPSPSLYFDYNYRIAGNKLIIDFTEQITSKFEYKIENDILTLTERKEYNEINPAAVDASIKYSIEIWKLSKIKPLN